MYLTRIFTKALHLTSKTSNPITKLIRNSHSAEMYKRTCTELTTLPPADVQNWLNSFDTVLTDCDGVLWVYNDTIDGSVDVVNRFKEIGKQVFFATNNSTKTRSEFLEKALMLKFNMKQEEMLCTAYVAAYYLKSQNFDKKVYVIGSSGITKELDNLGIRNTGAGPDVLTTSYQNLRTTFKADPEIGAVIVGFDEHISFPKMLKAATYLNNPNCLFIGTNTDERFPMPGTITPGTGTFVRAIETCAERQAFVVGKPNSYFCKELIEEHRIIPERTLMIGDRCNTDILLGVNCGFQTLLVGSGIHNLDDVAKWQASDCEENKKLIPDVYLPKLGDLLNYMKK